ncbi:MAG: hypothetical protein ABMB14_20610 [Myxococcota bacterium]
MVVPGILMVWAAATASASAWWTGDWGLDPSASDDPTQAIQQAYVGTAVSGASEASKLSPDGGEVDVEANRTKLLYQVLGLLGVSGRITLVEEGDDAVSLAWSGVAPMHLPVGNKWTKVARVDEDHEGYRIRVREDGDRLIVERRLNATTLTETLLSQPNPGELVVVVRVDGSALDPGVEFRRVYRSMGEAAAAP